MDEQTESTSWHSVSIEEIFRKLDTNESGLKQSQIQERTNRFGQNILQQEKESSPAEIVLKQLRSPLIYLLGIASLAAFLSDHQFDAIVILGVVILNTIIGFVQEWRAEKALEALRELGAPHSKVRRDGKVIEIASAEIVPGDILILETGARVGADGRILNARDLLINESALTGESEPVLKKAGELRDSASMADQQNMVWMSTSVTGGKGVAIVVSTGMNTAIGEIATDVRELERQETPLQQRLGRLGIRIGMIVMFCAVTVFFLGIFRGYETSSMIMYAIAVAVSAIPEGLPAVISIVLALGVRHMAERNAIVRRLPAVETLGSTTVICSDKTGTITRNEMTVTKIWAGGNTYDVSGEGFDLSGEIIARETGKQFQMNREIQTLLKSGILANDAIIGQKENDTDIQGNPTEISILISGIKGGIDVDQIRKKHSRIDEISFSSEQKYMATLNNGNETRIYVKGAPEKIVSFSSTILKDSQTSEFDETWRKKVQDANDEFAADALRVIAAAYREVEKGTDQIDSSTVETGLTFLGLWGMDDPPRSEAIDAIEAARTAGITVMLITGDHAVTASAIAERIGILSPGKKALVGEDVEHMSLEDLGKHAMDVRVFARVSPNHKLKIMKALQRRNQIVAMTGDGVNDAPALKGADIGIAMGKSGTEVAKEAADLILTDDNFATIVTAIEEGRVIFNNLRRAVFFLVTTNVSEIMMLTSAILLGFQLPVTAVMILWINLVTDGVCDIPLGLEPKHKDVLLNPPRPVDSGLLNRLLIWRILLLAPLMAAGILILFYYELRNGTYEHAQTVAFTTLAAFQWFHALNARSTNSSVFKLGIFSNKWLTLGILVAIFCKSEPYTLR